MLAHCGGGQDKPGHLGPSAKSPRLFIFPSVSSYNTGTGNSYPNLFANGINAAACFGYAFPGDSGARNAIRGPGFFGTDLGLAKSWKMPWNEHHTLQFRREFFNITNSVRFDVQSANALEPGGSLANGNSSNFGNFSGTLTNPRIMQFALRSDF